MASGANILTALTQGRQTQYNSRKMIFQICKHIFIFYIRAVQHTRKQ